MTFTADWYPGSIYRGRPLDVLQESTSSLNALNLSRSSWNCGAGKKTLENSASKNTHMKLRLPLVRVTVRILDNSFFSLHPPSIDCRNKHDFHFMLNINV